MQRKHALLEVPEGILQQLAALPNAGSGSACKFDTRGKKSHRRHMVGVTRQKTQSGAPSSSNRKRIKEKPATASNPLLTTCQASPIKLIVGPSTKNRSVSSYHPDWFY